MRFSGVGAVMLAVLSACGGDPDAELAAAKASGVALGVGAGSGQALVQLFKPNDYGCFDFNISGQVTIDDTAMDWQPPLGKCGAPMWDFKQTGSVVDPGVSLVRLVGGSTTWEMTVEHLFSKRSIVQSAVAPNEFLLTPSTDLLSRPTVTLQAPDGTFIAVDATYNAGTLTLTTPLAAGQYQFVEGGMELEAHVVSCDGPAVCEAHPFVNEPLTFNIP